MYRIDMQKRVRRDIARLPPEIRHRFAAVVQELAIDPRRPRPGLDCAKMGGAETWRVRIGAYRIIYLVDDATKTVEIVKVGRKPQVYA